LDVFEEEPPKFADHPLINRPDVIVTPHLGASTTEAQEGVAIEVCKCNKCFAKSMSTSQPPQRR
jgi:D-3-phosphoglycerate dehydrogenase